MFPDHFNQISSVMADIRWGRDRCSLEPGFMGTRGGLVMWSELGMSDKSDCTGVWSSVLGEIP